MLKKYSSIQQVQQECSKQDRFLFVYRNNVYDLTPFVDDHPGGRFSLQTFRGKDLENIIFNASIHRHQPQILSTLEQYKCGLIEVKKTQEVKPQKLNTPSKKSQQPTQNEQMCKTQVSDERTLQSNLTLQSKISIQQQQSNLLSPDSTFHKKSNLKQNQSSKVIKTNEKKVVVESSKVIKQTKQKEQNPQSENVSKASQSQTLINTNPQILLKNPPSIYEEDESQPSPINALNKFDCGSVALELANLKVPILQFKLNGFLKQSIH